MNESTENDCDTIEEDKLKIFGQSETRVAIFGFGLARKTQAY